MIPFVRELLFPNERIVQGFSGLYWYKVRFLSKERNLNNSLIIDAWFYHKGKRIPIDFDRCHEIDEQRHEEWG